MYEAALDHEGAAAAAYARLMKHGCGPTSGPGHSRSAEEANHAAREEGGMLGRRPMCGKTIGTLMESDRERPGVSEVRSGEPGAVESCSPSRCACCSCSQPRRPRTCSARTSGRIDRSLLLVASRQHDGILQGRPDSLDLRVTQTARDSDTSTGPCADGHGYAPREVHAGADGHDSTQPSLAQRLGVRLGPTTTFVTTEHFNLQTARAVTVSEANGRASIYLAALSSNLIALAFIGQMSRLGAAFYAFALILLPVLVFVGVVTFLRLVQSSLEDIAFAHRIALLRDLYLRLSPELEPYVVVVRGSRGATPDRARPTPTAWQLTLTTAGMVAVVNSVVVAAVAGLALAAAGVDSLGLPLAAGAVVGAGALTLHHRHHRRARDTYTPQGVDRAAIVVPPSPQADTA